MTIFNKKGNADGQWVSISDLMSVLMMIFLFIAVSYMLNVTRDKDAIKEIAITYSKLQTELYDDLMEEFRDDLSKWNADIDRQSLSVRFEAPEVLFSSGSAELQPKFKEILNDFFPRYIAILTNEKYMNDVEEIRIEGHTSSEWSVEVAPEQAYFNNMELSQNRTRKVLEFVLRNRRLNNKNWIRDRLTANGLSSSKLVVLGGVENKEKSRRVEFRVRTNAEKRIVKILTTNG
ncbi:MAG: OmpA family protein [Prevotellaceae bacterium]|jgi:outer membrane protein OmpA-like peptidoglycan-associated protein|nr:OmpA family protein [Prevotellaceae bacterium]